MGQNNVLEPDELLHLAIDASNKGDNEKCITLLKQAMEIDPKNAKVRYMLGAMHAQIGLYERAVEDMQKAVELDPKLETAHFQLGLLYITSGNVSLADEAWKPLDELGENNPLFLFKRGLLNLAQDKFEECIQDLQQGIKINNLNMALNKDMQMIISQAQEALKQSKQDKPNEAAKPEKGENHVFLSAYDSEDN